MVLSKGSLKIFNWLKDQKAGTYASYDEIREVTGWAQSSLNTYLGKNKLAPFFEVLEGHKLKTLLDGDDITRSFFHETFTQTAPSKINLTAGTTLSGDQNTYVLVEPLGQGAIGHVWKARIQGDEDSELAVKVMLPRDDLLKETILPDIRERFRREARNGKRIIHNNVVRYQDLGEISGNPFLAMELAVGSVADDFKTNTHLSITHANDVIRNVSEGLAHLHSRNLVHRDLKPANFLSFPYNYKLGDLGIVRWTDFDETVTDAGTITRASVQLGSWRYMAPEQLATPHEATAASDVYSLGVSWIELLKGRVNSPQEIAAQRFDLPQDLSEDIRKFILKMISYDASDRPTIDELLKLLNSK